MSDSEFELDMEELNSAEEFLDYFGVQYEPSVVQVNRLHILQRFHDYIRRIKAMPESESEQHELYASLLCRAYGDFVDSDAQTEKVFKVFKMHEPFSVEVSLTDLTTQVG
jgi:nitrogenase-stabilizing/protective protein